MNLRWKNVKSNYDVGSSSIPSRLDVTSDYPNQSVRFVNDRPRTKPRSKVRRSKPATFSVSGGSYADKATDDMSDRARAGSDLSVDRASDHSNSLLLQEEVLESSDSPAILLDDNYRAGNLAWSHDITRMEPTASHENDSSAVNLDIDWQQSMDELVGSLSNDHVAFELPSIDLDLSQQRINISQHLPANLLYQHPVQIFADVLSMCT